MLIQSTSRSRAATWGTALGLCLFATLSGHAQAATIAVDGSICTLTNAITAANSDSVAGGCAAGSGADILALPSKGTQTLTAQLPNVTSVITIQGNGSTISAAATGYRMLSLSSNADLTLDRLTITGFKPSSGDGGAILAITTNNKLTITNSTLRGNSSPSGSGGAVNFRSFGGALSISNSTISGNSADGTSSGNFAYGGGGLYIENGTATISNSTFSGNSTGGPTDGGGAILVWESTVTINNSTIVGNSTAGLGGGLLLGASSSAKTTLRNSIVAGNTATSGGNEVNSQGESAGVVVNANNLFGHSGETETQAFYNFVPGTTDRNAAGGAVNGVVLIFKPLASILNATLADNGGPTQTHALVANSPAINSSGANATVSDQRGYAKAAGDSVRDIGAYEFNGISSSPTVTALNPASGPASGGTLVSVTGTNFVAGATSVKFGNTTIAAGNVNVSSATSLSVTSPSGSGTVNVTVTTGDGTSATDGGTQFTYNATENGACGTASGVPSGTAPSANLCATGTATAVGGSSTAWTWGCNGVGGGTNTAADACSANYPKPTLSLSAGAGSIAVGGSTSVAASSDNLAKPTLSVSTPALCALGIQSNSPTGVAASISGSAAGTCTVAADLPAVTSGSSRYLAADQKTANVTVTKKDQTISFGVAPGGVKVGTTGTVSATASSNLTVDFSTAMSSICSISGSTVTGLKAGSCTVFANQAGDATYSAAPQQTQSFSIGQGSQSISGFTASPSSINVGVTSSLSATKGKASTSLVYSSKTTGICTVSGNSVSAVGVGTCTVAANQAGDDDYTAAEEVTLAITVGQGSQSISGFTASPSSINVGGTSSLSATKGKASTSLVYSSKSPGICTVSGSSVSAVASGTCTVAANQAGDANYSAAPEVTTTITVNKASQAISGFAASPASTVVGGSTALSATKGAAGTAVVYSSKTGSVCTVSGNSVSAIAAGTCTVAANQAGDANYNAAPEVTLAIAVGRGSQAISGFAANPASTVVGGSTALSATKGAAGTAVVYSSKTGSVCTVSGNSVSAIAAGTCTVAANQAGDADYTAAPEVTLNLTVGKGSQTISNFAASPNSIAIGGSSSLSATKGQGSAGLVYSSKTTSICTVSGNTVTALATGACTVAANQPGDANYNGAPEVTLGIAVQSSCKAYESRVNVNIIDASASPGGQTVRGDASRFNVIYGSAYADTITGGNAGNCIDGGAGNDRITAGSGENYLYGGAGNDTLTPGSGSTAMDGGAGTDKCGLASSRATATYANCESN